MGRLFLTKFLLAFEVASLLLLVAAVGAVILARRRSGLDDPRELSVADLLRSDTSGTLTGGERGSLEEAAGRRAMSHHLVPDGLGADLLHRRRRRAHAPQPARDPALPRADAQRGQPRAGRLRARTRQQDGQIFALIVMVVAACEVAVGLGLIVALYRRRLPIDVDELRELQG
jgi:hypothetical protein